MDIYTVTSLYCSSPSVVIHCIWFIYLPMKFSWQRWNEYFSMTLQIFIVTLWTWQLLIFRPDTQTFTCRESSPLRGAGSLPCVSPRLAPGSCSWRRWGRRSAGTWRSCRRRVQRPTSGLGSPRSIVLKVSCFRRRCEDVSNCSHTSLSKTI